VYVAEAKSAEGVTEKVEFCPGIADNDTGCVEIITVAIFLFIKNN
jgi:hypothetical protein